LLAHDLRDLVIVRDTFVPVIKFERNGTSFDVIVACVNDPDEVDRRCMSVEHTTRALVEQTSSLPLFCPLLLEVKLWAVRELVYSNPLGLLNGVALAVMSAWLLKNYPVRDLEEALNTFMYVLATFDFKTYAIDLYNPTCPAVPGKEMTVFVPTSTKINALYNVGPAQFFCVRTAAQRSTMAPALCRKSPLCNFVDEHSHFVHLHIFTDKPANHAAFRTKVDAKLKVLVRALSEYSERVRPLPKEFSFESERHYRTSMFVGLSEPREGYLACISDFAIMFAAGPFHVCTDVMSVRHLPSFFITPSG
jgi:poly(A) polymerase Pap1